MIIPCSSRRRPPRPAPVLHKRPETTSAADQQKQLDALLIGRPSLAHAFVFDSETGLVFRSQPAQANDPSSLVIVRRAA